jgi:NADPH2:quinone reductase
LAEPALRSLHWGGRFVTVGYASGQIPRIPLNLVLLKGCEVLGFQFRDFAEHRPDELRRNDDELWALLAEGAVSPQLGATFPLDDVAAALGVVAAGQMVGKVILDMTPGRPAR